MITLLNRALIDMVNLVVFRLGEPVSVGSRAHWRKKAPIDLAQTEYRNGLMARIIARCRASPNCTAQSEPVLKIPGR